MPLQEMVSGIEAKLQNRTYVHSVKPVTRFDARSILEPGDLRLHTEVTDVKKVLLQCYVSESYGVPELDGLAGSCSSHVTILL